MCGVWGGWLFGCVGLFVGWRVGGRVLSGCLTDDGCLLAGCGMAVGLMALLEQAQGADGMDPDTLRNYAHDLGASMGLLRDRLDKDLKLYASNLEKMAQAVELMEETVAAEKRKRERRATGSDPESDSKAEAATAGAAASGETAPGVQTAG